MSFWSETVIPLREEFFKRWPKAFAQRGNKLHSKIPLKIGIHKDIEGLMPEVDPHVICLALSDYCQGTKYLRASYEGAKRIDLDGSWSDEKVTKEQRLAHIEKERRRTETLKKRWDDKQEKREEK